MTYPTVGETAVTRTKRPMPYVSHTRVYHVMSPKVGQDISSHPEAVHVDGRPLW